MKAIICEIDGVLADDTHRRHFVKPIKDVIPVYVVDNDLSTHQDGWENPFSGKKWKPDYESYYAAMGDDKPNEWAFDLIRQMEFMDCGPNVSLRVFLITSRPEKCRKETVKWLRKVSTNWDDCSEWLNEYLFMRPDFLLAKSSSFRDCSLSNIEGRVLIEYHHQPDNRSAYIVKREIYDREIAGKYEVLFALESDEECIEMYRSLGITGMKVVLP